VDFRVLISHSKIHSDPISVTLYFYTKYITGGRRASGADLLYNRLISCGVMIYGGKGMLMTDSDQDDVMKSGERRTREDPSCDLDEYLRRGYLSICWCHCGLQLSLEH
jgi:hypothetical protein